MLASRAEAEEVEAHATDAGEVIQHLVRCGQQAAATTGVSTVYGLLQTGLLLLAEC